MEPPELPVFEGTPFDIGRALGCSAGAAAESLAASESWRALQTQLGNARLTEWIAQVRSIFPDCWDELRGMADGMGIDADALFLWNCRVGSLAHVADDSCTIAVNRLGSRFLIHAQHCGPAPHEQARLVEIRPRGRPAFTCMHWPGSLAGPGAAASRLGLLQVATRLHGAMSFAGLPPAMIARAVLAADSLASALDIVMQCEGAGGAHHILASTDEFIMAAVEGGADDPLLMPVSNKLLHLSRGGTAMGSGFAGLQALYGKLPAHPDKEDMLDLWRQYRHAPGVRQEQAVFLSVVGGCIDLDLHPAPAGHFPLRVAGPASA